MSAVLEAIAASGFDAVVVAHHGEIRRYLSRVTRRGSEAEDLAQETFLRAYRAFAALPDNADRRAWLYKIATNAYRNHVRSERRRRSAYDGVRLIRHGVDLDGPEGAVAAGQTRAATEAAIRRLPLKQRLAFTMRKLEELDYDVIGHCLDCSAETARAHVFQALRKVRAVLDVHGLPTKRSRS